MRDHSTFRAVSRWATEVVVAIAFLLFAAESWAHRAFSADPAYGVVAGLFAVATATIGLFSLLHHLSRRLLILGAMLLAMVVCGFMVLAAAQHMAH